MTSRLHTAVIALATTAFLFDSATHVARAEAGYLECQVGSGWGYLLGSSKPVTCVFTPADGGLAESYSGEIQRVGFDIGYWSSRSPHRKIPRNIHEDARDVARARYSSPFDQPLREAAGRDAVRPSQVHPQARSAAIARPRQSAGRVLLAATAQT